jgi:heme/copper-type cytochrome/quinol oxidase subunit 2
MQRWWKVLFVPGVVAILGISLGYPASQLVQSWSNDRTLVLIKEPEEGYHEQDDEHEKDHEHEGDESEAEHIKPAFETYGLVQSEPGYKEFDVKLSQFSFKPDTLRVHRGDRVRLNLDSVDVVHGLAIDGYDSMISVPVEKVVTVEFVATQSGAMRFRCAVTCGAFHPFMVGRIVVEPETTFPWAMLLVGTAPLALLGGYILWRKV